MALTFGLALGSRSVRDDYGINALLNKWAGKEISTLSAQDRSRFMGLMQRNLIPNRDVRYTFDDPYLTFENNGYAYVWRFGSAADHRFLILLNPHTGMVPSAEHAWLFNVTAKGSVLKRYEFDTGWRMHASGATYGKVSWLCSPVLVQRMREGMNGGGPRAIYIGFDGDRPAVVRLEDESGAQRAMDYFAPNWVVGPPYSPPSVAGMEKILMGSNEVKLLESLVWLSGSHQDISSNRADVSHEDISSEIRYAECVRSPTIVRAIKSLLLSKNPYVRQLAKGIAGDTELKKHKSTYQDSF